MIKVYEYKGCGTCKKALKLLDEKKIQYKTFPIRETPPSKSELNKMLGFLDGNIKRLFNTSGQDYRNLGIKNEINDMTPTMAIDLLSKNGNLIKRPFILGKDFGLVGLKEQEWDNIKWS